MCCVKQTGSRAAKIVQMSLSNATVVSPGPCQAAVSPVVDRTSRQPVLMSENLPAAAELPFLDPLPTAAKVPLQSPTEQCDLDAQSVLMSENLPAAAELPFQSPTEQCDLDPQSVLMSENLPAATELPFQSPTEQCDLDPLPTAAEVPLQSATEQSYLDPQPVLMAILTLEEICCSLTELQQLNSFCSPFSEVILPTEVLPSTDASNIKQPQSFSGQEMRECGEVYWQAADPSDVVEVSTNSHDQDLAIDAASMIDSHFIDDSVNHSNEGDNNKQNNSTVVEGDCEITDSTESESESLTRRKSRNGQARPERWIRNMNRNQRMNGEGYCGRKREEESGEYIVREPRLMGPPCCSARCQKSKKRCCSKFSEDDRERIFTNFWQNMNWEQRKMYVSGLVNSKEVASRRDKTSSESRRQLSLEYHLRLGSSRLPVCKVMFLSTLNLGELSVRNWSTANTDGIHQAAAKKSSAARKSTAHTDARERVKDFLIKLPKLPSHYCRSSSSKEYLEPHFQSLAEVYRAFQNQDVVSHQNVCRQIFTEEFCKMNLGLFQPKKDQCDICCSFKTGNVTKQEYDEHQQKKEEARNHHSDDKRDAEEGKHEMFTMDVQAVQLVPHLKASALYFKQKLAIHNFTVYNVVTHDVVCYVWHEGEGEVTANVYASCITHFIDNHTLPNKDLVFYSDGCGSQNRNATLSNVLLSVAHERKVTIFQKYLEKGHTQMECDSVHSVIERKKKNRDIFTPAQFVQIIEEARVKQPYKVHYLSHDFFKDYSSLQLYRSIRPGTKVGDPTVCDLRCLKYTSEGEIMYNVRHAGDWSVLPQRRQCSLSSHSVEQLYGAPLKIRKEKFKDLQSLKSVIFPDFHSFYDSLLHT